VETTLIPALEPWTRPGAEGRGHRFLVYGDCCSGIPGSTHERTFASVNAVARRIRPEPEFIWYDSAPWSSLLGATPWGAERLQWQPRWSVGHDQYGERGRPWPGRLRAAYCAEPLNINW
jgi:hypothetical protein